MNKEELKNKIDFIKERVETIFKLTGTNCSTTDVSFGFQDTLVVHFKSKEYSDHMDDDEVKAKEVLTTMFPFATLSVNFPDMYIKEENIADFLILISLDNDSLKLYYELRK